MLVNLEKLVESGPVSLAGFSPFCHNYWWQTEFILFFFNVYSASESSNIGEGRNGFLTFQDKLERMKKKGKLYICAISFFKTLTTTSTLTFLWLVFIVAFMDFQLLKEIFQIYLCFDLNFGQCCHRIGQSSNQYLQFQW